MFAKAKLREAVIECIDCGCKSVIKGQIELGQELVCPECETWMQIVSLEPIEVDWIYEEPDDDQEEQEDW